MTSASELPIVKGLLCGAQSSSKAHRMLAEAKTARQTDGGHYGWVSPEQTVEGRAAALITELVEALELAVTLLNAGAVGAPVNLTRAIERARAA